MAIDFQAWPKIPRLNRAMIVTEKIDGTNSAVIIEDHGLASKQYYDNLVAHKEEYVKVVAIPYAHSEDDSVLRVFEVGAQSRKRLIRPGDDNFGFAKWVWENAENLIAALGPGRHFGEWWGNGIQRGYGLPKDEKRFSLFNVSRYRDVRFQDFGLENVSVVPILFEGAFDHPVIQDLVSELREVGSYAHVSPAGERLYRFPEGVVVFHVASQDLYKVLCENDEIPKGEA